MSNKIHSQMEAYRRRAEEVRTVADGTRDRQCREALIRIAEGYDRLARGLESTMQESRPGAKSSLA
jgi:hypothetical protein